MIVKAIEKPMILLKLEALTRRLPINHQKQNKIIEDLAKRRAGYNGESSLKYYLDYLSSEKYHIFHSLRLHDGVHHFQMDFLILTPKFILIIEVKNYLGTLYFDPIFNQLIRQHNDKEETFQDPLLQINRHKFQLSSWLAINKLTALPIEALVVISNPQTTIKSLANQQQISQIVIHSDKLLSEIRKIEQKHSTEILTEKEFKKLTRQLLKRHEEHIPKILESYEISQNELITGVFCPECNYLPTRRVHGGWYCPSCKHTSPEAHLKALKDYALLIGTFITNQHARKFLNIESVSTTKRILSSSNLPHNGQTKARTYNLSNL